jgi:hypothetical protein
MNASIRCSLRTTLLSETNAKEELDPEKVRKLRQSLKVAMNWGKSHSSVACEPGFFFVKNGGTKSTKNYIISIPTNTCN